MLDCEQRAQPYLFRLRLPRGGQRQIKRWSRAGRWHECGQGWHGKETPLRLNGWSRPRRVIVLRRRTEPVGPPELTAGAPPSLLHMAPVDPYEYVLLVTNTDWALAGLGRLYRERADSENTMDELQRRWGWARIWERILRPFRVMEAASRAWFGQLARLPGLRRAGSAAKLQSNRDTAPGALFFFSSTAGMG